MTTTVTVEEVQHLRQRLHEINSIPLEDIVWTMNDNVIAFEPKDIAEWKYTGLPNVYFIEHMGA